MELRRLSSERGEIVMLFNHGTTAAEVSFDLSLPYRVDAVRELTTGAWLSRGASDSPFALAVTVPPETVRVYRLDRARE